LANDALETLEHVGQGLFEIGGLGGQCEAFDNGTVGPHRGEDEVGAAGVERQHGALVV